MGATDLLTAKQAAAYLGLQVQTLSVWRCQRRGPKFVRLGRAVRYRRQDLDAFIEANCVETVQSEK